MPHHCIRRLMAGTSVAFSLLVLGCIDKETASTQGTSLYVFDSAESASTRVLIWDNVDAAATSGGSPTRTLKGAAFDKVKSLAWGGLCLDASNARLYLVSEAGDVLRVERIRAQNGTIVNPAELVTFRLGRSEDRLSGGTFGQAAVDPRTGTLYVTESNDSAARIWQVDNPGSLGEGSVVTLKKLEKEGLEDQKGTGVAVSPDGGIYAYFDNGGQIRDAGMTMFDGPRLRKGTSSGFAQNTSVIIGDRSGLDKYGCLAYDFGNQKLFLARYMEGGRFQGSPIVVFNPSQFSIGYNQSPSSMVGGATLTHLRVISHAGNKDWLAGSSMVEGKGSSEVLLWKSPLSGGTAMKLEAGTGVSIRGLGLDGSN